ncbi:hypothetical protein EJ110_NYTH02658 [Nymphaea thermarum]|nr:hypothetical protein EJ110_NYTH02658 [Nymphaea thermarum]
MSVGKNFAIYSLKKLSTSRSERKRTIQYHIHQAISNFSQCGKIAKSTNRTNLLLIPMFHWAYRIEDFHPIVLCNCLYKIISKVMVNHMQSTLNHITSLNR